MLHGKKILLCVSGSIAAYKTCFLTRLLIKNGAEVQVLLTPAAMDFVTPTTLATLSKKPVYSAFVKDRKQGVWSNHVEFGLWADIMIVAPATANILAKMAHGICDNLVLATYLSARCPVFVAPAMDLDMYQHPSTKENITKLRMAGVKFIEANFGELASGLVGDGRMAEPEEILEVINFELEEERLLDGKKVLVNAGPTWEPIDPVRFIGNHSSGKMGIALANEAARKGALVTLVCGPIKDKSGIHPSINQIHVVTAKEMHHACMDHFSSCNIAIMAAAVADFTPKNKASEKIKKKDANLVIELVPTNDILKELGGLKKNNQLLIGFALETENELENASMKLSTKNLDFIVLNSLKDAGAGFGTDTNKVSILSKDNKVERFDLKSKEGVARDIILKIINLMP